MRSNLIYITIENNAIHIEYDGIEQGITQDLIDQDIPKASIVLAFLTESPAALAI